LSKEILFKRNAIRECLRDGRRRLHRLLIAGDADLSDADDILAEARRRGLPIETTDKKAVNVATHGERHQNMILEVGPYPYASIDDIFQRAARAHEAPFIVLLDLVQDPRNVGALIRTADAMGAHGLIIQERRGCEITPTVVNTAAGGTEHLRVAQVVNLVDAMRRLKERDVWLAGLDLDPKSQPIASVDLNMPLGLVIGNEGSGLRRLVRDRCDLLIHLPMYGQVQSLNAAVAGSVALYAARAARARPAPPPKAKS
jgi:23S rRNA (guanosine2251-2'-O)-methyltransferase